MIEYYASALVSAFTVEPIHLETEYVWPRHNPVPYDQTFQRRLKLSDEFSNGLRDRADIAKEMVHDWGGILAGQSGTEKMAHDSPNQLMQRGLVRVASWSKVITLHDPWKYFIYDARVAFSINSILLNSGVPSNYFPNLSSRNVKIDNATKALRSNRVLFGRSRTVFDQDFYAAYLNLVQRVAAEMETDAWKIEMALFARAPKLATRMLQESTR